MWCISVQPRGHSHLNHIGILIAHRQMSLTAYSSFQVARYLFQFSVFSFHHAHFIRMSLTLSPGDAMIFWTCYLNSPKWQSCCKCCSASAMKDTGQPVGWPWLGGSCRTCPAHHFWRERSFPEPGSGHPFLPSLLPGSRVRQSKSSLSRVPCKYRAKKTVCNERRCREGVTEWTW